MVNNTFSSKSIHLLFVLLLLCIFLCRTESALPSSKHELLSVAGRRMMGYYKPNTQIETTPSTSTPAPGGKWSGSCERKEHSRFGLGPEEPIEETTHVPIGGGTSARLILELWPSIQLEGWEIDEILIQKARDYLGLSELEIPTSKGGRLCIHVDDALLPSQDDSGKYAGIIVDLFADGKVLDELQQVPMWLELASRLMPKGRIIVNCAGIETEAQNGKPQLLLDDSVWMLNSTIKILSEAFPGQVSWKRTPDSTGLNFVALTGGLPDLSDWSKKVPVRLSETVKLWKLCNTLNKSVLFNAT